MTLSVVRFGEPKAPGEGLRIGTVRRPPRGVPKSEYAARHLYDVWFPNLAPSEALLKAYFPITQARSWRDFKRRFLTELKAPDAKHDLELIAALSHHTNLAVGCYCESPNYCHRSLLAEQLAKLGARLGDVR